MVDGSLPLVVGIAGPSGSGKTTLAQGILNKIGTQRIAFLPHDAYYRNQEHLLYSERLQVNYDHPDALETELLIMQILKLKAGQAIELPVYDFKAYTRSLQTQQVLPRAIILVEGILIFADPRLRDLFDVRIYVDAAADICFIRRLQRDIKERGRSVDSIVQQYLKTVRPSLIEFVEPSKRYADLIVPEGGMNQVALAMVTSRLHSLLSQEQKDV